MKGVDRILVSILGILVVFCIVVAGAAYYISLGQAGPPALESEAEAGCLASGGTVGQAFCCLSVNDFPDTCLVGACACSAENSHAVQTCTCPAGTCFNGTACRKTVTSFAECAAAGFPVMESYPRQCRVPGGTTFVEQVPPQALTAETCRAAGGNWNTCSSRCRLDNIAKPETICPALCEALCECSGFAGFRCPDGYTCQVPAGIPDALGYCVPSG